jgi:Tfp pilus assembly protein PilX
MSFSTKIKENRNTRGGFVILYAILITTVVLGIGLSLLGVLIQQVSLSGAERESLTSMSAADSGIECALYWDIVQDAFRTGTDVTCNATPITCEGNSLTVSGPTSALVPGYPGLTEYTCSFIANLSQGSCADLEVSKITDDTTGALSTTTVKSRGYNTACPPAPSPKPWRLERGLQTEY